MGCDPLIEHPEIARVSVAIVSPSASAPIVQSGAAVAIEYVVDGCERVQSVQVSANDSEVATSPEPLGNAGHYQVTMAARDLLAASDWPLSSPVAVNLGIRLTCADYHQEAPPAERAILLSPVDWVEGGFRSDVCLLARGDVSGSVLAASADGLDGYTRDRSWHGGVSATSVGLLRAIGPYLYLWSQCRDTVCVDRLGTMFRLGIDDLSVNFGPHDPLSLLNLPADLIAAPDPGRVLLVLSGGVISGPIVRLMDANFGNPIDAALDVEPIAPARARSNGEVVFVGFPRAGGSSQIQVIAVGRGGTVTQRRVMLALNIDDVLVALSNDGEYAAIFDKRTARLYRVQTADALLQDGIPIGDRGDRTWSTLTFAGSHLLLASNASAYSIDYASGAVRWKQTSPTGILTTTATRDSHVGVMTSELDLLVFDDWGRMVAEQGPLPSRFQLTSNLLSTDDGFLHYALGGFVMSYQYAK
jgi:hypothetical protein